MSFLAHMCRTCPHPDFHHESGARKPGEGGCSYGWCQCKGDFEPESTLIETWTPGHREQVHELIEPGQQWNPGTPHRHTTCSCERCKAKYRELVA